MIRTALIDLGLLPYTPAFHIQEQVFEACSGRRLGGAIILQENTPIFTVGRAGSRSNILASPAELDQRGIEVLDVNRGGDVTYHGPGQLIVSPLLYLGDLDLNANQFLHSLEDVVIQLLSDYGIESGKDPDHPGVWVGKAKLASVGLAVRHGFTFHGFSINANVDLFPFQLINPCGVPRMPVTSLTQQAGREVTVDEIRPGLLTLLAQQYGLEFESFRWQDLQQEIGLPIQKIM